MELMEKIAFALTQNEDIKDKCPFCGKAPHDFPKKKKGAKASTKVKSKPKNLGVSQLDGCGQGKWTTAAHHLIAAKQCYAVLAPLVRMGNLAGYDINSSPNGIALPTFKNPYKGDRWGGSKTVKKKYGDLGPTEKEKVAFWVMDSTKAQWHCGHHAFEQQADWDETEGGDDSEMSHVASYDTAIIDKLYEIWEKYRPKKGTPFCEKPKDDETDLITDLDNLSAAIKASIDKFSTGKPAESKPYFVSALAVKYADPTRARS